MKIPKSIAIAMVEGFEDDEINLCRALSGLKISRASASSSQNFRCFGKACPRLERGQDLSFLASDAIFSNKINQI